MIPIITLSSLLVSSLSFRMYIVSGRHQKVIEKAVNKLNNDLTDRGVFEFLITLNRIKKLTITAEIHDLLKASYTLVKKQKNIQIDSKAQFKIALRLKGLDV